MLQLEVPEQVEEIDDDWRLVTLEIVDCLQDLFQPLELQAMVVGNENYDWEELERVSDAVIVVCCILCTFCERISFRSTKSMTVVLGYLLL